MRSSKYPPKRWIHSRRSAVLAGHLADLIPTGSKVLDVGCGDGLVAKLLKDRRADLTVSGIDTLVRPDSEVPVQLFDGKTIPLASASVDVVLLVDVLHHADRPLALLAEATRVAKRFLVVKDHTLKGFLAGPLLLCMDWVGNSRYGVCLPFCYWPKETWIRAFSLLGLRIDKWRNRLGLYPRPLNSLLGRSLHFAALLEKTSDAPLLAKNDGEKWDQAAWELAYLQFETPEQEVRKFLRRLTWAGAKDWPRNSRILELFCGRGNGLIALERLGFMNLAGVDISRGLAARYAGNGKITIADCRKLPFADQSQDIIAIQGGLHHLLHLEKDLTRVMDEINRVLVVGGKLVVVEPWLTPFLRLIHWIGQTDFLRLLHARMDALQQMIHLEKQTYFQWLGAPNFILEKLQERLLVEKRNIAWGKLSFVGSKQ